MQCPKCAGTMERVTHLAWHVHRCTECKGLWFDMGEHEQLKDYAEEVDTGDARRGEAPNEIDHIDCPVCAGTRPLISKVDPQQPHSRFES